MEDTICPRCKTSKFQNPSLKMMVNVCGHALCESCVDLLFLKGSGACPDCRIPLRRNNFRVQLFEDATVEKEVDIRKRVLRDFNKKEEDFATLREYNDYLEEVETIIYNLCNNIDIINTNKRIEDYKRSNKEQIMKSKNKMSREEYELEELLEVEKQNDLVRRNEMKLEEMQTKKKKLREKEALIDELMFSNANAKNILETFTINAKEAKESEFGKQTQSSFLPVTIEEGPLYMYKSQSIISDGPEPPAEEDLVKVGYTAHIRSETEQERAGGFVSNIACMRALQDALAGLYHVKKVIV
ncbi:hypothetical protein FQR65_LT00697 [Abscondita terminalis]|nr:hypothetical protein FQR65_LT00697 [Abscondita terminalis]